MIRVAACLISATALILAVTACDLSKLEPVGWPTFGQIDQYFHRLAFRVLNKVRLHSASTNQTSGTPIPHAAQSAAVFQQSIGVNVHMGFTWTPYADVSAVKANLAYLGVDHVRDEFFDWPEVQTNYAQLAAAGIKFNFTLPVYLPSTVKLTEFVSMISAFVQAYPGSVTAIEGPNEVNDTPAAYNGGTTLPDQAALQKALYAAVRAEPNLNGIPVYNLSLANIDPTQYAELGDLSSAAHYANSHAYVGSNKTPAAGLTYLLPYAQLDAPGLPIVITETGYNTDPNDRYSGVNESVQARYTLDTLLDAYKKGVARTYLYELLDEASDPANSNRENHFGLFNSDGTPKVAATAMHNLTAILADPASASSFTPGNLSYALPDLPSNGNQLLLQKSSGIFDLVLWAEAPIWDSTTQSEVVAPPETTLVKFGEIQKVVRIFDPIQGTTPVSVYSNVQSIQVELTDHPIIIEIPPP